MPRRPRRIVIATDLSPGSAAAVGTATSSCPGGTGTCLDLVHVVEPTAFAVPPPLRQAKHRPAGRA